MREIKTHKLGMQVIEKDSCHGAVEVYVIDEQGQGGAHHHYRIEPITGTQPAGAINSCDIQFQNGPIKEVGVNGINEESLLAVIIDRYESFQNGPYKCRENAITITKLQEALQG